MIDIIKDRKAVVTTQHRIELKGTTIIQLLNQELKAQGATEGLVPSNATVIVTVPGGGDWSNTELDIDTRTPVTIEWTERTEV